MNRVLKVSVGGAIAALALASCSQSDSDSAGAPASESASQTSPATTWLLTVSGEGKAEAIGAMTYLTLSAPGDVLGFTSRPGRTQVTMPAASIVALWQGLGFEEDPPNAAVSSAQTNQAVVLENPVLTADGSIRWLAPGVRTPVAGATTVTIDGGIVNSQATDGVTETNVKALGRPAADSLGNDFQLATQTMRNAAAEPEAEQLASLQLTPTELDAIDRMVSTTGGQAVPGSGTPTESQ